MKNGTPRFAPRRAPARGSHGLGERFAAPNRTSQRRDDQTPPAACLASGVRPGAGPHSRCFLLLCLATPFTSHTNCDCLMTSERRRVNAVAMTMMTTMLTAEGRLADRRCQRGPPRRILLAAAHGRRHLGGGVGGWRRRRRRRGGRRAETAALVARSCQVGAGARPRGWSEGGVGMGLVLAPHFARHRRSQSQPPERPPLLPPPLLSSAPMSREIQRRWSHPVSCGAARDLSLPPCSVFRDAFARVPSVWGRPSEVGRCFGGGGRGACSRPLALGCPGPGWGGG